MHRMIVPAVLAAAIALVAAPAGARAATSFPADACTEQADGLTICSGEVPSFDGTPLDVDLTRPAGGTGERHPLIVLLHGFGNDKHEWESTTDDGDGADKDHWNSHWFARRGFYVLTYTARGFRTDPPSEPYQPPTPSGTSASLPSGTIQLKSRTAELRDTQWLAALAARAYPDLNPERVAVSGGSYGGGESWLQASRPLWTFPHDQDPGLPVLHLRVAIPKYPWTDLGYGLAPSGHGGPYDAATTPPDGGGPIGIVKASYTDGFFAIGSRDGIFENLTRTPPSQGDEGPISIPAWAARLAGTGEPYDIAREDDPVVAQARRGLTDFRSSYYHPEGFAAQALAGDEVAVFDAQGWTDDLFPPVEAFRQFDQLKAIDPHWPVTVVVADIGHARAQNPPETWRWINAQANAFLDGHLGGSQGADSYVASEQTDCGGDTSAAARRVRATTPQGLGNGVLQVGLPAGVLAPGSGAGDPDGPKTDPIVGPVLDRATVAAGNACRTSTLTAFPGRYTALSAPLPQDRVVIGPGTVELPYQYAGATTATVIARLWDQDAAGRATLMTKGVYRLDAGYDPPAGTVSLPLFGNHWTLAAGHRLRLDLVQVDAPEFRPNTLATATVTFGPGRLRLPTLQGTGGVLEATGGTAPAPAGG